MSESTKKDQKNKSKSKNSENYDRAILLIQNQVQLFWLIFGSFLLSETVLLSAITSIDEENTNNLTFWGSILGLIICFLWWITSKYNHAFYILRINEAKNYEPDEGDFFSNGLKLFNGDKVHDVYIPKYVSFFHPIRSMKILIVLFFLIFLSIGILNFP
jgi:hypothetical protein